MEDENNKPEYIYVEEEYYEEGAKREQEIFEAFHNVRKSEFSLGVRIVALIIGAFSAAIAFLAVFLSIGTFALALVTGFKNEGIYRLFTKCFNGLKLMLILTFGGFFGIFSPPLGIGFVLMYFLITGQNINDDILVRMYGRMR